MNGFPHDPDAPETPPGTFPRDPDAGAASAASSPKSVDIPGFDKVAVLGNALWLMSQSGPHKFVLLEDLEKFLIPPVALQQYRLWRNNNLPAAFATWAFLNDEGEARVREGVFNLREEDWNAGTQPWLMDIIAPFGGLEDAAKELKEVIFKGQMVKTLRAAPNGGIAVVEW